jgi:hypothetical protein
MSAKKATQKSTKSTTAIGKKSKGFTDEERAAMKERAQELKAEARRTPRGAGRPLEAHLSRTMIVQQSAEDEFG